MLVIEQQKATEIDHTFVIQIKFPDCSATSRSQANKIKVIRTPGEMSVPVIMTRMKEWNFAACRRIDPMDFVGF
jgi:hypothetical protein